MLAPSSYGMKVRIGAAVSHLPCDTWKISSCVSATSPANGNGMRRSVELNSSFDMPATMSSPSTYAMSVTVALRTGGRLIHSSVPENSNRSAPGAFPCCTSVRSSSSAGADGIVDLGVRDAVELDLAHVAAGAVEPHDHRGGLVAQAAHDRQVHVAGTRVDREVAHHDVVVGAAEERGEPRAQVVELERLGGRRPAGVGDVDRDDRRAGRVGDEQHVVGPEGDRPDGRELRSADLHAVRHCRSP